MTAPAEDAPRTWARWITAAGAVAFLAALYAFWQMAHFPLIDAVVLTFLLVLVPALSMAQLPLIDGVEIDRVPAYWSSIFTLWFIAAVCLIAGGRDAGVAALGIVWIGAIPTLLWSLGLTAVGMGIIFAFRTVAVRIGAVDAAILRELLPRTAREKRLFAALSVAAGTGEELAYRGYSIPLLASTMGVGWAAALTTVVFGLMHGYQGRIGIVRTACMGGVLAWGFLASGSLWPAMIAHTAIDVLAGIVFGARLLSPSADPGV